MTISTVGIAAPATRVSVTHPKTTTTVSQPKTAVSVSHPQTSVTVKHPSTNVDVSHPTTIVAVTHPQTSVSVSHPTTVASSSVSSQGNSAKPVKTGNVSVNNKMASGNEAKPSMMDSYQAPKAKDLKATRLGGGEDGMGNKVNEAEKDAAAASFDVPKGEDVSMQSVLKGGNSGLKSKLKQKVEEQVEEQK